jgi:hypothetical protein
MLVRIRYSEAHLAIIGNAWSPVIILAVIDHFNNLLSILSISCDLCQKLTYLSIQIVIVDVPDHFLSFISIAVYNKQ